MRFGRLLVLFILLAAAGIPAGALRAACVGRSCSRAEEVKPRAPFCPLPDALKAQIAAGYRDGRSPDVLSVTRQAEVGGGGASTGADFAGPSWPSASGGPSTAVPIVFWRPGVEHGTTLPPGTGLDAVAPTLAEVLGLERPHPEVRSGRAVSGVAMGQVPRLVLQVAWKGVGSEDLTSDRRDWPFLRSLLDTGAGTMQGDAASLPLDPAATLTTIGTGGLPSQHGITGTLLRNDRGRLRRAWTAKAPLSIIATLGDDLDRAMGQRPLIGLVATDTADRGIVGGDWYIGHDTDPVVVARRNAAAAAGRMLAKGFGADHVPDLLAVVMKGPIRRMDGDLARVVVATRRASGGSLAVIVTATGSVAGRGDHLFAAQVVHQVEEAVPGTDPVVEAAVAGGLFLDQAALGREDIGSDAVVQALLGTTEPQSDSPLMADAFQGFAVSFERYC